MPLQSSRDSLIRAIITHVSPDSIRSSMEAMQDFSTRYALANNRDSVVGWLHNQFTSRGYSDIQIDSFYVKYIYDGKDVYTWQKNVIATLWGSKNPDKIILIGAHYDSITDDTDPMRFAPGADDNASGTSAVLEIARVLTQVGFIPEITIKFVAFAAEELSILGSKNYADKAKASNVDIRLMVNLDVIAYSTLSPLVDTVRISYYQAFPTITDSAMAITRQFTTLTPLNLGWGVSDDTRFAAVGYPAVAFIERTFSPYHHTIHDSVSTLSMEYCAEVAKAAGAVLMRYSFVDATSAVKGTQNLKTSFMLFPNYPNPFNSTTKIRFRLPIAGYTVMQVSNILGQTVQLLVNGNLDSGDHLISFDAAQLPSGMYFYSLRSGVFFRSRKLLLIK